MRADLPESDCLLNRSVTHAPCKSLAAQSVLLCQSGRQGANHFRLSGTKSSNTKKLSIFAPHKVVIRGEWGVANGEQRLVFLFATRFSLFAAPSHHWLRAMASRAAL